MQILADIFTKVVTNIKARSVDVHSIRRTMTHLNYDEEIGRVGLGWGFGDTSVFV